MSFSAILVANQPVKLSQENLSDDSLIFIDEALNKLQKLDCALEISKVLG